METAVKITLRRLEGTIGECTAPHCDAEFIGADCWTRANAQLREWARTAPSVGYNKVSFVVTYGAEDTYTGRFDMTHEHRVTADLGAHIRAVATYARGERAAVFTAFVATHAVG